MDASLVAINIAYFLYVAATIPKRIVPLRLILVAASIAFIVYGLIDDNRSVIVWNLLFVFPQLYQLVRELRAQAMVRLTEQEESIRAARFSSMSARDFLMFWSMGEDRSASDEPLIVQNKKNENLVLVISGNAVITDGAKHIADRGPGNILGEASFVTGEPATATVEMTPGSLVRVWPYHKLDALTRAQPDVAASLLSTFAKELSLKMRTKTS